MMTGQMQRRGWFPNDPPFLGILQGQKQLPLTPILAEQICRTGEDELGPGILKIHLFQPKDKSKLELQGVAFGLAVSSPSALATMIRIIADISKQMGQPMSPHEVEMLEQQLQPTEFQPPNEN